MRTLALAAAALLAAGCNRSHIRTYDLEPQALLLIQDEHQMTHPVEMGERYLVSSDKETLVVIQNVRQTRYPLAKGWNVYRDIDSLTIEEIPTFKPY